MNEELFLKKISTSHLNASPIFFKSRSLTGLASWLLQEACTLPICIYLTFKVYITQNLL